MNVFESLFKYKPIVYQQGHLAFQLLGSPLALYPVRNLLAAAGAFYAYRGIARDKWSPGLVALRAITFAVLAFIFFRPVLNISTVLPQESYLAVVIDNSESMNIRDDGKETRAEQLTKQFEATNFFKRLNDKFHVRTYRVDKEAERIDNPGRLDFAGKRTRRLEVGHRPPDTGTWISAAVRRSSSLLMALTMHPSSGRSRWGAWRRVTFLFTRWAWEPIASPRMCGNRQRCRLHAKCSKDSTAVVDVSYRSFGFPGQKAMLQIRENGTLLKTEEVTSAGRRRRRGKRQSTF